MPTYKTPNVYVEEISTFPPSVAEVSTAIPTFIGTTEKAQRGSEDLTNKPTRISTLLDYETQFGGAEAAKFDVRVDSEDQITSISSADSKNLMYYALRLYFDNGGGSCYVVSVGNYSKAATKNDFQAGLDALEKEDEPTLILLTDAIELPSDQYYELCQAALMQCNKLKDRFVIFDVLSTDTNGSDFRQNIGTESLKYGAAYYPYIQTSLSYHYTDESVTVGTGKNSPQLGHQSIVIQKNALYHQIKSELDKQQVVLPPSAAVAGVYARVDRDRGVWKAPANVSLLSVLAPTVKINNEEQENFNIDPTAGKSINLIRSFTGKGTLVWGARTLAGNDNEWRYIPVRRLFNLIEESLQKAIAFFIFESNNAITWLKVKSVAENYLDGLWRQGALAGTTEEQAYFVNIGLGKSMTTQDILEGRMIVEVGIAAVRPAEFIVLKFSHKLQES